MLEHVGQGNLIITLAPTDVVQDNTDTNVDASQEVEEHTRNIHRLTAAGAHVHIGSMDTLPTPINLARAALLDQCATLALSPADTTHFDYILCGGILGTDEMDGAPMVDRTAGIRRQGLECRHLGTVQMTADTAVIVAKRVLVDGQCMDGMKFSDRPSVEISKR